jgi:hypothetical protein
MLTNVTIGCSCFVLEKNSSEFFPFLAALSTVFGGQGCVGHCVLSKDCFFRDAGFEPSYLLTTHLCAQQLISLLTTSVADPDPGSSAFLTPGSGFRDPE